MNNIPVSFIALRVNAFRSFAIVVAGLLYATIGVAQNDLPSNEIEVIKHFDARLVESQKVSTLPRLPDIDTAGRQYQYQVSQESPKITYLPPQVRPLAVRAEALPAGYRGLLRAGYGIPNEALGEVSYALVQTESASLLISGHHLSANNKDRYLQKFSSSGGALDGHYHVSSLLDVSGGLSYDYDKVYFYGLLPDDDFPYVDPGRAFKKFMAHAGIANTEPVNDNINYKASIGFYDLQDDLATHETGVTFNAFAEFLIGGSAPVAGSRGTHALSAGLEAALSSLTDTEEKRTLDNFSLLPKYTFTKRSFTLSGGVNIAVHESEAMFFPVADISARIAGQRLVAFVSVDGGLKKNNFLSLSSYNPFIHQIIDSIANTEFRSYAAGVKGVVGKISYLGRAEFSLVDNLALFEPDRFDYRKFQPLYDNGNIITIEGELTSEPIANLSVSVHVAKMIYDLEVQDKAWYLPGFEFSILPKYITEDKKLQMHGGLTIESGVPFINEFGDADHLKGLFDLSAGADYYFTKNIGAFVQLNNLLGNKYARWQNYPTLGINGVAGVLVRI